MLNFLTGIFSAKFNLTIFFEFLNFSGKSGISGIRVRVQTIVPVPDRVRVRVRTPIPEAGYGYGHRYPRPGTGTDFDTLHRPARKSGKISRNWENQTWKTYIFSINF